MAVGLRHFAAWALICGAVTFSGLVPARAGGDVVAPVPSHNKFTGWWELGGFYGTDESSRGEIVLFTPLAQSASTLFFLDARGKLFEEDVQEANLALGYRQMMPSGWNLGLWAGWDIRDTEEDNTFHQASFGLEALSERYDLRVNGYVPITDPKGSPGLAEVFLRGNNILMIGGEEVPLYGVDGEVGILLFGGNRGGGVKGAASSPRRHELRAYAGGFWFDADDALEEVAGPKGRLEYRINDVISSLPGSRLTIESELSYDEVRDTKFEIGARLRIPFGARGSNAGTRMAALSGQELRMIEGLERDTDIITVQSEEENVFDNATNVAMNAVSFASDATGFANAVNEGGNRLIILQDDGAQIDVSATDGQQLQTNQTVQGGGSTINYRGARSGTVARFRAPGSRPTLFTSDGNNDTGAITLASNTHVAGVSIRGVGGQNTGVFGNTGIQGPINIDNVVLEQLDIRNMGNDGIEFEGSGGQSSNLTVKNVIVTDVSSEGINSGSDASNVLFENVTVRRTGAIAIRVGAKNSNTTLRNITVADGNDIGIFLNDDSTNVTVENAVITNVGPGILLDDGNTNVTLRNISISGTTGSGIGISEGRNINIVDSLIADTGGNALFISGTGNTVNVNGTTFAGTIGGDILNVVAAGNTINGANNPNNAAVGGFVCDTNGNGFTGTLTIGNQTFVNGAGCN